ncbi:MATE family efflux transporter [Piscirickettsia litoralis]|uniref:MATE family efflux transporter n=1 Tax=Piscirickettsia litoralis TaxID=1891921 RepID=A0ABX3A3Z5_9GAMM|nr:MATE family efflux transporter [Piscirickettsia litoralis]ODN42160.1 hypothetical protein BGC07_03385 [Piscirickettsia litoralis]
MKNINTRIIQLAVPLILSNLTIPLLGLTNTFVVGHLHNSSYLAAVGLGTTIFNFIYWSLGFLRMTTTGVIAQAQGQNSSTEHSIISHSLLIAFALGVILLIFQSPIEKAALILLSSDDTINTLTAQYYAIRIWAAPAALINYVLIGTCIGLQKPITALALTTAMNLIAIILDIIFVFHLHMDIKGVALADVVAQFIAMIVGLFLLKRKLNILSFNFNKT